MFSSSKNKLNLGHEITIWIFFIPINSLDNFRSVSGLYTTRQQKVFTNFCTKFAQRPLRIFPPDFFFLKIAELIFIFVFIFSHASLAIRMLPAFLICFPFAGSNWFFNQFSVNLSCK